ncbi:MULTISPECIES: hypothetical protein [unclassified Paraburkholderia]|uniref:hypothetical protein n=1 Tax=unclassified Paraburkholderia TaxID=2615204 RepID=UPI002AB1C1C9|nr:MULTISPECIES: hypothetical protein [unclassified Paraburkholderia]
MAQLIPAPIEVAHAERAAVHLEKSFESVSRERHEFLAVCAIPWRDLAEEIDRFEHAVAAIEAGAQGTNNRHRVRPFGLAAVLRLACLVREHHQARRADQNTRRGLDRRANEVGERTFAARHTSGLADHGGQNVAGRPRVGLALVVHHRQERAVLKRWRCADAVDGAAYLIDRKPIGASADATRWSYGGIWVGAELFASFKPGKGDFRKLIVQRPEGA